MLQEFPASGFHLRTHRFITSGIIALSATLGAGFAGVIGIYADAGTLKLFYDEAAPSEQHIVAISNSALIQDGPRDFVWPATILDSGGTRRELKVLSSSTGPYTVIYLHKNNA